MMTTKPLRSWLTLSDIHLGTSSTPAKEILDHLTQFFDNFTTKSQFCSVDIIFIAGDLWHDTLEFSSDVLQQFIPWARRFLLWCGRNQIKVRVLEGTPRHDRRQSATFSEIASVINAQVDFKYIPVLSVEYLEDLDLNILYVPDECRPTAEAVQRDVEELLHSRQLQQVDIAIMHGMFKYQMGKIPMNNKVHDENWYLDHVKHYINIGHVHSYSQYAKIVAQGSFDRLKHGEEEPKGAILVKELTPGEFAHFFIENPLAKVYKTVEVKGDLEASLKKIDREIRKLPLDSRVRIQAIATHPIFNGLDTLKLKYPHFIFSKKVVEKEEAVTTQAEVVTDYIPIILNAETLTEAVFSEVCLTNALDLNEEKKLYQILELLHD